MPVIVLGIVLVLLAREVIVVSENVRQLFEWQLKGIMRTLKICFH